MQYLIYFVFSKVLFGRQGDMWGSCPRM